VPLRAPAANQNGQNFRVSTPYYARKTNRQFHLILEDRPDSLKHLDQVNERIWAQYQRHLKRTTPLERALFYTRQMEVRGLKSAAALERALREPPLRVWRSLRLLELPEPVRQFLTEHRTPEMVRYFTERKLLDLLRLREPRRIWRRFQEMVTQARRQAGIWRQSQEEPSPKPQ